MAKEKETHEFVLSQEWGKPFASPLQGFPKLSWSLPPLGGARRPRPAAGWCSLAEGRSPAWRVAESCWNPPGYVPLAACPTRPFLAPTFFSPQKGLLRLRGFLQGKPAPGWKPCQCPKASKEKREIRKQQNNIVREKMWSLLIKAKEVREHMETASLPVNSIYSCRQPY